MNYKTIVTMNNARIEVTPDMPQEFHSQGPVRLRVELVPVTEAGEPLFPPVGTAADIVRGAVSELSRDEVVDDEEDEDTNFPEIHPEDDLTNPQNG